MENDFIVSLVYNISLLLVMVGIYSGIPFASALPSRSQKLISGLLIGLIGVAVMANPWQMRLGVVFDVRSVLLGVTGLFFGPLVTAIVIFLTGAYRVCVGGAGVLMGVGVIVTSGGLGLLWRRWRPALNEKGGLFELYLFGMSVHLLMLACTMFLPQAIRLDVLRQIMAPVLFIYPVATVLLSIILIHQRQSKRTDEALRESKELLESIVENVPLMIFLKEAESLKFVLLNRAGEKMLGHNRVELIAKSDRDFFPPEQAENFVARDREVFKNGGVLDIPEEVVATGHNGQRVLHTKKVCINGPDGTPKYLLGISEDITGLKQAETEHERLITAIEQAGEAMMVTDTEGTIQYVNPAFEKATGYSRQEVIGRNARVLRSGKQDGAFYRQLWDTISSGGTWRSRLVNKRKDGTFYTEEATISPVVDTGGKIVNYVSVSKDITEQLQLEGRLLQSQKMEAVGLLAGGIAHDFNNLLTAMRGYCSLVDNALVPDDPVREDMREIMNAADRAATLTRQLLAFSRRQIMLPKVVDLNKTLADMLKMLRRIIGEEVQVSTKLFSAPCLAKVDPGQIEQVLVNLALNARDAVAKGGEIKMTTEVVTPPEEFFAARPDLARGQLVCVKVSDNGCGIAPEVKKHMFEPFYTTKEQGKGTGLGLSTVYGIVKQSGGEIEVESAPGQGATFKLYFPLVTELLPENRPVKGGESLKAGTETVLFVEDEESLRRLGERLLRAGGYEVIVAENGREALAAAERRGKPVDLLMTDVVMPGMSGRELALELNRRKLAHRTLYMSGYTDEAIVKHGVLEPGIAFIYKPFTAEALYAKIREVLEGPADKAKA
jgi:PAS domain S-box-containing protein